MDRRSALEFMDQLAKVIDWLEKHSSVYKAEVPDARSLVSEKRLRKIEPSERGNEICDSFMQQERRVPRNICNDASVEAKKALTGTLRGGLEPLRKSMLFCLNEGDETYVNEFCSSLEETAKLYFSFEIACHYTRTEKERKLTVSISRTGVSEEFELRAIRLEANRATAEISKHTADDCVLKQASNEDFQLFIAD